MVTKIFRISDPLHLLLTQQIKTTCPLALNPHPERVRPLISNQHTNTLITRLHSQKIQPENLSHYEESLVAYQEIVGILNQVKQQILQSIKEVPDMELAETMGDSRTIQEANQHIAEVMDIFWEPIKTKSEEIVQTIAREAILSQNSDTPKQFFPHAHKFDRVILAENIYGGIGTAWKITSKLIEAIPSLLQENFSEENFFKVAYNLSPILNQIAMLNVGLIMNEEIIEKLLFSDRRLRLDLKTHQAYYDTEHILESPTIKLAIEEAFKQSFFQFKPKEQTSETKREDSPPVLPYKSLGCPAHYSRTDIKDIPPQILPADCKKNSLNLIEIFLFHYLYLLKLELGGRFNEINFNLAQEQKTL